MKHCCYTLLLYSLVLSLLTISCSENLNELRSDFDTDNPIIIESTYPVGSAQTRASMENGFVEGDAVGIFVVDYDKEGNPGTLALKGERAGNIHFSYDGSKWTANYQLYWKNSSTPADFYGYYPYDQSMQSVTDYSFGVSPKQDSNATSGTLAGYEASDLLWAKSTKVMPTTETVSLQYRHLMAGISIQLVMGTGFEASEWATHIKTVQIENTILNGKVDLSTGSVAVTEGSPTNITPLNYNESFRAVVFPQTVAAGKSIVSVTIDGKTYLLKKEASTTFLSGKMHNMTITVNKSEQAGEYTLELADIDIVAWIDDPDMHDGLTIAYTTIVVEEAGKLKEAIDAKFDNYRAVKNLKIVGPMNANDRRFIQENLNALEAVNMAKVEMEDGCIDCFNEKSSLRHFVFPEHSIKTIGWTAFCGTSLSGSLVIPEGVESVSGFAFAAKFSGTLTLPSTLKSMDQFMGYNNKLTGELHLPEGIEVAVAPNGNFSGSLYFPSSLKEVLGYWSYPNMTGTINIPACMTEIPDLCFQNIGCSQLEFHDGVKLIGAGAFRGANLQGELVLPPNVIKLSNVSFAETKISHIIFNDRLRIIDNEAFTNCKYLTGTQRFAENVARVSYRCFEGCTALTGIILPKNVELIEDRAFYECYSLNSIVCENPEPPVARGDAFYGVPKDNFTVEVPKGSVEKYREAPGWREFKRIAEYSSFVCRPMQANALNTAHTEQLVLNADGTWQVEHKPEWVTLSKNSGKGKSELTLSFSPMPHGTTGRTDTIRFVMPDEGHETFCVVRQYDYEYEEDSYLTLQKATQGRGIDIVFLGDGYDGEDISNGKYLNLVREQVEYFFDLEPYKSHRDFFNVYAGFPLSQEKGVNTMNTYVNNRFGTLYGYDGRICVSNQLLTEDDEVYQYAVEHTPVTQDLLGRTLIILVPNSDAYSGVTYFRWNGAAISICPPSSRPYPQDTRGVIQHEAGGHGFGRLGDEEIVYNAWAPANVKAIIDEKHRNGEYANLSTISGLHSVPWADFVFDTRYSDYVDVYEGGLEYMRGIFRPEQNSCMNYGIPYYNAPSRLSIMRRIFGHAGMPFSMDYFYQHDSKEWGSSGQTRSSGETFSGSSYAGSNQHRMPQTVSGKEMANRVREIRKGLRAKMHK